jgi:small subunit ribosomal protein S20
LANTKSAEKRARQSVKRAARNRWYRSRARTFVKRAREHVDRGELDGTDEHVRRACRALDKAAQKGAIHPNNAARRKSRLMLALNRARAAAESA